SAPRNLSATWTQGDVGGGTASYVCDVRKDGATTPNEVPCTPGSRVVTSAGTGSYTFRVRATNTGGVQSDWSQFSAPIQVTQPPRSVTLSRGGPRAGTSTAWHFHLEVRNFAPGSTQYVACYSGGSRIPDGSGNPSN